MMHAYSDYTDVYTRAWNLFAAEDPRDEGDMLWFVSPDVHAAIRRDPRFAAVNDLMGMERLLGVRIKVDTNLPPNTLQLSVTSMLDRAIERAKAQGVSVIKVAYAPSLSPYIDFPPPTLAALLRKWRGNVRRFIQRLWADIRWLMLR